MTKRVPSIQIIQAVENVTALHGADSSLYYCEKSAWQGKALYNCKRKRCTIATSATVKVMANVGRKLISRVRGIRQNSARSSRIFLHSVASTLGNLGVQSYAQRTYHFEDGVKVRNTIT